jgi:hypothetical protein
MINLLWFAVCYALAATPVELADGSPENLEHRGAVFLLSRRKLFLSTAPASLNISPITSYGGWATAAHLRAF